MVTIWPFEKLSNKSCNRSILLTFVNNLGIRDPRG